MEVRKSLRCSIVRGGTSKGIFIRENELPSDPEARDEVIRAVFGSPDTRQIDGLGGADVLTSKLAIIGPSSRKDADVDYTFAQVSFDTDKVDYSGNCGNISSAVGPYAIDEGMVRADGPLAKVRIHMKNTGKILTAYVPTEEGRAICAGDFRIDGVPGTGAKITLDWSDTAGGLTGKLLPTGNVRDVIQAEGRSYEVTLIDAGNPVVFIKAEALDMKGTESPYEIEHNASLMRLIEKIRGEAAVRFGLCGRPEEAAAKSPYNPFFSIVSEPSSYVAVNGEKVGKEEIDVTARLLFMLKMHKAYPITGTVATAAALRIPGSVVYDVLKEEAKDRAQVYIGHPSGRIPVESEVDVDTDRIELKKAGVYRTARRIMDGIVYLPERHYR
ncbi:hypothetical protein CE91St62_25530 [Lachnospiraceae bacterium]|uniref:2-methylaconitate cis-trans isomerase PrpF family protein n=1 Tax=Extibacter sp. GGCC_0201 TaxID=2731209 RepID=UPI001AA11FB1|nr:PrpF domain-containing protein [Extibacter sp. GGCC_0201]MBO1720388.1 3-methylitaconate isomerase [Extibacter sp. GGCC_0201]BDF34490.1 hypothetical protein CE91St61_25650 [Lachnospiraceae bacterium]BDF38492.1 hypothetical protein CE91St62_25530 [Lachnospiraceae bacterium]